MLTGFQVSTGAYSDENGELLCETCFDRGDSYCRPVSNYELDERQAQDSEDMLSYQEGEEQHVEDCSCQLALYCDSCGDDIRPSFDDDECIALQLGEEDER